jgi:TonB family protein
MKGFRLLLFLTLFFVTVCPAVARDGVDLRLRLQKDQVFRYATGWVTETQVRTRGREATTRMANYVETSYSVLDVDRNGNYRISASTRDCIWRYDPGMVPRDKDKAEAFREKYKRICRILLNNVRVVTINPWGTVLETSDMSEMDKELDELFPRGRRNRLESALGQQQSQEEQWKHLFTKRPHGKVEPGDTWTADTKYTSLVYRVEKVENGRIHITGHTPAPVDRQPPAADDATDLADSLRRLMKLNVAMSLDTETGMPVEVSGTTQAGFNLRIGAAGPDGSPSGERKTNASVRMHGMLSTKRLAEGQTMRNTVLAQEASKDAKNGAGEDLAEAIKAYVRQVMPIMASAWKCPQEFLSRNDLSAFVTVKIDKDGKVLDVWLEKTSRNGRFDEAALAAARSVNSLPPPPPIAVSRGNHTMTVGFRFSPPKSKEGQEKQL